MAVTLKGQQNSNKKIEFSKITSLFKKKRPLLSFYFLLVGLGFLFLCTALVFNDFTTPFGGDYCSQQFAFYTNGYDDWWHFFKTGEFVFYDTNTFLGANNIGSNTFYYLFDPFFMPILLVPRQFIPQGMAILTVFKIATGGLAFYAFMRYFGVSQKSSKVISTAYAFCGWTAWYLWFNHFTEVIICLPLILLGIEKVLKEKNPILLSFSLFLTGVTNYFFMITFCLCGAIYALWRYFQRIKLNSKKDNWQILGIGIGAFLIGLLLSCVAVLPSAMVALESDRATSDNYLELLITAFKNHDIGDVFDLLFSWKNVKSNREYRSLYPIIEFFYPVTSDRGTPLTKLGNETYDNVAGGLFCFTPIIILLTPALIRSFKDKKYSHLAAAFLFIVSLFTPFTYYLFHGFTQAYSRWYIFLMACLLAYVGIYLDKFKEEPSWTITVGGVVAFFGVLLSAALATYMVNSYQNITPRFDILYSMIAMGIYTIIVVYILRKYHNHKFIHGIVHTIIGIEVVLMGAFTIYGHGLTEYRLANNGLDNNNALHAVIEKVSKEDKAYYRSYSGIVGDSAKNDGMRNGYNSASFFHSVYNFNTMNFIEWSKIVSNVNGWSGMYVEKRLDLDTFLGMKYYYILKSNLEYERLNTTYIPNTPIGFADVSEKYHNEKFFVFENKEHINFAFSYDSIMNYNSENYVEGFLRGNYEFNEIANEELYLKHAILNYEDAAEVNELYPNLNYKQLSSVRYGFDAYSKLNTSYGTKDKPYNINLYLNRIPDVNNRNIKYSQILEALKGETVDLPKDDKRNDDIIICIEPGPGQEFPYDPNGVSFFLEIDYVLNYKHDVYFIGENDELITMDRHSDNYISDSSKRRDNRGFYLKPVVNEDGTISPAKKLKKIVLLPRYGGVYKRYDEPYYPIAYQKVSDRDNLYMNEIREHPITNVVYDTNKFEFDTNYDEHRFICTQIAFDKGWKVFAYDQNNNKTEVKTYLTQGGFVGFVSSVNQTHYKMVYETPYLRLGNTLSIIGGLLFIGSCIAYYYVSVELNKKKLFEELLR